MAAQPNITLDGGASSADAITDLDELLSADIRLAEMPVKIAKRSDLEARISELDAELAELVDGQGRPIPTPERTLADRTWRQVYEELQAAQAEHAASVVTLRLRQLAAIDWDAFVIKHRAEMDGEEISIDTQDELIAACLVTNPATTPAKVKALRGRVGGPAMVALAATAMSVNTSGGVSVPKSAVFLAVTRLQEREQS